MEETNPKKPTANNNTILWACMAITVISLAVAVFSFVARNSNQTPAASQSQSQSDAPSDGGCDPSGGPCIMHQNPNGSTQPEVHQQ